MPEFLNRIPWRSLISTISLPMVALSASFGIYAFSCLFIPPWVAFANAAAFQWFYLGLMIFQLPDDQRHRAAFTMRMAVAISIGDNYLSGLLHFQPERQATLPLMAVGLLCLIHSMPLGFLAHATSDLRIHSAHPPVETASSSAITPTPAPLALPTPDPTYACPSCSAPLRKAELGAAKRYGYCSACKGKTLPLDAVRTPHDEQEGA
ncbi:hypothetical protein EKD04_025480 [Chloroflexales bacterium ZM16-3]|nr:hypothetical protein [Chloroflexales bacterium ZM16-3]